MGDKKVSLSLMAFLVFVVLFPLACRKGGMVEGVRRRRRRDC